MALAVEIRNGEAVDLAAIPVVEVEEFRRLVLDDVDGGGRIAALFGQPAPAGRVRSSSSWRAPPRRLWRWPRPRSRTATRR